MKDNCLDTQISLAIALKTQAAAVHKDMTDLLALRGSSVDNLILSGILTLDKEYELRLLRQLPKWPKLMDICAHTSAYLQLRFSRQDHEVTVLIDPHADWAKQVTTRIFSILPALNPEVALDDIDETRIRKLCRMRRVHRFHSIRSPAVPGMEAIFRFAAIYGFQTELNLIAQEYDRSFSMLRILQKPAAHDRYDDPDADPDDDFDDDFDDDLDDDYDDDDLCDDFDDDLNGDDDEVREERRQLDEEERREEEEEEQEEKEERRELTEEREEEKRREENERRQRDEDARRKDEEIRRGWL